MPEHTYTPAAVAKQITGDEFPVFYTAFEYRNAFCELSAMLSPLGYYVDLNKRGIHVQTDVFAKIPPPTMKPYQRHHMLYHRIWQGLSYDALTKTLRFTPTQIRYYAWITADAIVTDSFFRLGGV